MAVFSSAEATNSSSFKAQLCHSRAHKSRARRSVKKRLRQSNATSRRVSRARSDLVVGQTLGRLQDYLVLYLKIRQRNVYFATRLRSSASSADNNRITYGLDLGMSRQLICQAEGSQGPRASPPSRGGCDALAPWVGGSGKVCRSLCFERTPL